MKTPNDESTTLAELRARVLQFAEERQWRPFHSPKNLSMAIAAEAAELMEPMLWVTAEESHTLVRSEKNRSAIEDELADIVIYCLQFANQSEIDLTAAITRKLSANAAKYPVEKSRGNARKYTEL